MALVDERGAVVGLLQPLDEQIVRRTKRALYKAPGRLKAELRKRARDPTR